MSILLGNEIKKEWESGNINISPFNKDFIGPNSIDVTLNRVLKTYEPMKVVKTIRDHKNSFEVVPYNNGFLFDRPLDMAVDNETFELEIPKEGLVLLPGYLYLGTTNEEAGSDQFVPMYEGRSSLARLGIQSHISAGFGDIGFGSKNSPSKWTLEITVVHPVRIYADARIGQVYFHDVNKESLKELVKTDGLYKGKYCDQATALASKSFLDFTKDPINDSVIANNYR